jgi:uncharacterized protein (DUF1499 family)
MSELFLGQSALIRATRRSYKPMLGLSLVLALSACSGTAPDNLGVTDGRLAPCPSSPNCVSSQASGEHFVEPLALKGSPAQTQALLKQVLLSEPRTRLVEENSGYLRAEFTSSLLRFVDDVEFLIDDQAVAVRSASRLGHSDLGVNRKRVEHLRQRLHEQPLKD